MGDQASLLAAIDGTKVAHALYLIQDSGAAAPDRTISLPNLAEISDAGMAALRANPKIQLPKANAKSK